MILVRIAGYNPKDMVTAKTWTITNGMCDGTNPMLVCTRLRHVAGTQWGNKKFMNMKHLEAAVEDASMAG